MKDKTIRVTYTEKLLINTLRELEITPTTVRSILAEYYEQFKPHQYNDDLSKDQNDCLSEMSTRYINRAKILAAE